MAATYPEILESLLAGNHLSQQLAEAAFTALMQGEWLPEQTAGFLVALRAKGEMVSEVTGAAKAMRAASTTISAPKGAVDMCGTGGDGLNTVNVSTAAALVVAASGIPVAKHGNRSVSSKSGSADVLEALGISIDLQPEACAAALTDKGFAFLFAPNFHPAMKHAIGPRRALKIRTIFNLLGPLTNPAEVEYQLIGVFSRAWVEPVAQVLKNLGTKRAIVAHSEDGLDELSLSAPTFIAELDQEEIQTKTLDATALGFSSAKLSELEGGDAEYNAGMIMQALHSGEGPIASWIALNAAGGIRAATGQSWTDAVAQAWTTIRSGKATEYIQSLSTKN